MDINLKALRKVLEENRYELLGRSNVLAKAIGYGIENVFSGLGLSL